MDTNSKTGNSTRSASTSVQRLTPSELRERLFQEQEARIAELVRHNAELTVALEHEREQSRRHATAHQIAQAMLITAGREANDTIPGHVPSAVHPTVMFSGWGMAVPALLLSFVSGWSLFKSPYHSLSHLASEVSFWQVLLTLLCLLITSLSMLKASKEGNADKIRQISNCTQMALAIINIGAIMIAMFREPHLTKIDWYAFTFVIIWSVSSVALNNRWLKWLMRRTALTTAISTRDGNTAA